MRWRSAALGAVLVCLGVVAGCGDHGNGNATGPPPTTVFPTSLGAVITNDQGIYISSVLRNRDALFAGYVVTPTRLKFRLRETTSFEIVVCGASSPRKTCVDNLAAALAQQTSPPPTSLPASTTATVGATPTPSPTTTPPETTTAPPTTTSTTRPTGTPTASSTVNTNTVPIGGQVRVTVTGDPSLTIQSNSLLNQPVLLRTESASWSFNIIPSAEGTYFLTAHVAVLQGADGPPLFPEQTVLIPLEVFQTSGDRVASGAGSFWKIVQQVAAILGASGISVGALVGYLVRRSRKRRQAAAAVAAGAGVSGGPPWTGQPGSAPPYPQSPAPPPPRPPSPPAQVVPHSPPPPTYPPAPPTPPVGPPGGYPQQPTPFIPPVPPERPEPPTRPLGPQS